MRNLTIAAALVAVLSCGDPPLDQQAVGADGQGARAVDGAGVVDVASDTTGAPSDALPAEDSAASVDVSGLPDVADTASHDAAPSDAHLAVDAAGDVDGGADAQASVDTTADGLFGGGDGATDGAQVPPCANCPFDKQPTGAHPAAKGTTSVLTPKEIAYKTGLGNGDKKMRVWVPLTAGSFPVLFFVHGKQLYETGGLLSSELGHAYKALLEHVASRGYIVAFVRVENGLLDCDHEAMAQRLVDATAVLFSSVSKADKSRVAFAGHSMGAKIALLAARRTINQDPKNKWPDPQAVLLFNLDNSKPPACLAGFTDAREAAEQLLKDEPVRITFVHTDDDQVTPFNHKENGAVAVYDKLKLQHRQFIVLHGTGPGDKNAATSPELHDDHSAALTVQGAIGGVADITLPASYLDALDWYGYWKLLVGALDFHYKQGDPTWAYGAMRTHGGVATSGAVIEHVVLKQGW